MIEKITHDNRTFAIIFYKTDALSEGVSFYTPDDSMLQVGKHKRSKGTKIKAHYHLPVRIEKEHSLSEVLFIQEGKVKITFYDEKGERIDSKTLNKDDAILLIEGGHGFEFLEPTRMLEVKQGPYSPASRKNLDVNK